METCGVFKGDLDLSRADVFELVVHICPLANMKVWLGDKQWTQTLSLCGVTVDKAVRRSDTVSEIIGTLSTHPPVDLKCVFRTKSIDDAGTQETLHCTQMVNIGYQVARYTGRSQRNTHRR